MTQQFRDLRNRQLWGVAADGVPAHNAAADDGQEAGEDRDQRVN